MLNLAHSASPKSILLMGAHCDDIEIGCGATVLSLVEKYPEAHFDWVIFSSTPARAEEAIRSSGIMLSGARSKNVVIKDFRNGYFPYIGDQIKDYFELIKTQMHPDLIFTHHSEDKHQDHRTLAELTWNTFRDHLIYEYEIPKYDGGLGSPNCFIPTSQTHADKKIATLLECFASEKIKSWFTAETFAAMLRIRGIECNSATGFAEAFYCRKFLV